MGFKQLHKISLIKLITYYCHSSLRNYVFDRLNEITIITLVHLRVMFRVVGCSTLTLFVITEGALELYVDGCEWREVIFIYHHYSLIEYFCLHPSNLIELIEIYRLRELTR